MKRSLVTLAATAALMSVPFAASAVDATSNTTTGVTTGVNTSADSGINVGSGTRINGGIHGVTTGDSTARSDVSTDVDTDVNTSASNSDRTVNGNVTSRTGMSNRNHASDMSRGDDMRDRGRGHKYGHDKQANRY